MLRLRLSSKHSSERRPMPLAVFILICSATDLFQFSGKFVRGRNLVILITNTNEFVDETSSSRVYSPNIHVYVKSARGGL